MARLYSDHGASLGTMPLGNVSPNDLVSVDSEITAPRAAARVSLHLEDDGGIDRGSLQEVPVDIGGESLR